MAKIALSFDVEPDLHTNQYLSIEKGLIIIKKILDKHNVKGTFFATCDCIEKYPQLFKNLENEGHEIALHGYRHERFDDLTQEEKEEAIKKSILVFEKYLKQKPKGFRAPQHSIDKETIKLLEKYDFKYDSSKTPLNILQLIFFPTKKGCFFSKPSKYKIGKLTEIPSTSLLIPFVSLVLRVFPRILQKLYLLSLRFFFKEIIFYAHSWDFIEVKKSKLDRFFPHKKVIKSLYSLIDDLKKQDSFVKIEELIK